MSDIPAQYNKFILKHDADGLKSLLGALPSKEKGNVFEAILAELYRGNGWLVQQQGGRGDAGADILLYHPKTPSTVSLIIQAKNHSLPLTLDQARIELIKFEEQSAPLHNCQNFRLVAVNGYVREAHKLGEFNLLLDGWEHIEKLVQNYEPESAAEPSIELFAHNRITYQRINELWEDSRHVAVVQATGTGKSYLIAKVLADFLDKRKVVLAPSTYILEQQKSKIPWLADSTDFLTYAKLGRMTGKEISTLNCGLIVLDEFHRCGADVWGAGVQKLLDSHPDAKVLGTTATPIRYLDDSRNMAEELFDGIVAEDLSLAEAIVRRILPPPTYISALYTLNEECSSLLEEVEASKRSDEEKSELRREINAIRLDWEKTSGVPEILKQHFPPGINKLIVFCKDQQHLDEMEIEVQHWFLKAGTHQRRKTYRILTADPDSDRNLEEFKKAGGKDTVHLLFAIDMLNEGLHIPEVGAVILLRPTESPIVFYQQIGRCIQVGSDHTPIIFDLVNNFQNVRANDFIGDIEEAKEAEARRRGELGLSGYAPSIKVEELARSIEEVLSAIRERLVTWEVMFEALLKFAKEYGHSRVLVSYVDPDGHKLGIWVSHQRNIQAELAQVRRDRLEALSGWSWDRHSDRWEEGFRHLKEFVANKGHARVFQSHIAADGYKLGVWIDSQRRRKAEIPQDRRNLLEGLPEWSWNLLAEHWEQGYRFLEQFAQLNGHAKVPISYTTEGYNLGVWVNTQRNKNNEMSQERRDRLEKLAGWSWDPYSDQWEEGFRHLESFVQNEGHARVTSSYKADDGYELGAWVVRQRKTRNKMSQFYQNLLEELPGWCWEPLTMQWEEGFKHLQAFVQNEGNAKVSSSYIAEDGYKLGRWVCKQRDRLENMTPERRGFLESLDGWSWNPHNDQWEEGFKYLEVFVSREGHAKVPRSYVSSDGYNLGGWVSNQRSRKNEINQERKSRLEALTGWNYE